MKRMSKYLAAAAAAAACAVASAEPVDFTLDIMPILGDRCFSCHGPDANQRKAGLRLDLEDAAKDEAIVPGKPDESPLIQRIMSDDPDKRMPHPDAHKPPLTEPEIDLFRRWVAEGAPWEQHWAFVKPERPALPEVSGNDWAINGIDHFVLKRMREKGLEPSPEADRETLIRRLAFDLRGLPPTLDEIDRFLADDRPGAYERVVDRMLDSPGYGEHMAARWLDGARYADTNGYQNDFQRYQWPWRDWVIEAYNQNMPFDQFTVEQLAGDLLPNATDSQRVATGFNRNNRANTEGGSIEAEWLVENLVDRVETTSTVFLGLTMGCARCHDHKYDPISQKEFYEFYAFFNSSADKGFYEETRGNTGPLVELPTEENKRKLDEFSQRVDEAREALKEYQLAKNDAFFGWSASVAAATGAPVPRYAAELAGDGVAIHTIAGAVAVETARNNAPTTVGLAGPAVQFDSSEESYVALGDAVTFDRETPFTVALWVRPDAPGSLFSKMDDSKNHRGVDALLNEGGELSIHLVSEWSGNAVKVTTIEKLRMGTWAHVAVTYDGSSKAEGVKVFFNGNAAALRTDVNDLRDSIATDQPLRLGRRSESAFLKGAVSDLTVFDRPLGADEAKALAHAGLARAMGSYNDEQRAALRKTYDLEYGFGEAQRLQAIQAIRNEQTEYERAEIPTVMVMEELPEPRPTYRLNRGAYDQPDESEVLSPAVPEFLPPLPEGMDVDRLALAKWIVAEENPLTARVIVNRLWHHVFGRGLVKTVEDFGVQGSPPTHPQLLDWLATEFIRLDWDYKALQKTIVMSASYRQSSAGVGASRELDPENLWLSRGPRFRLPAEIVRDNALAVSGLLSKNVGGPSVMPYQPENLWSDLAGGAGQGPYEQATGEDLYRRSLYTYRKRTVPHPTLTTFDAPSWELCRVRRGVTNTPLQALALLNDTTYVEAARKLAERMVSEGGDDDAARLTFGFRVATGRTPSGTELAILKKGLNRYLTNYAKDADAVDALLSEGESPIAVEAPRDTLAAYTSVAGVLLNLDETITKE